MLTLFLKSLLSAFFIGLLIAVVIFVISIPFYIYNRLKAKITLKIYKEMEEMDRQKKLQEEQEIQKLEQKVNEQLQALGLTQEDLSVFKKVCDELEEVTKKLQIVDPKTKDVILEQLLLSHGYKIDKEKGKFVNLKKEVNQNEPCN